MNRFLQISMLIGASLIFAGYGAKADDAKTICGFQKVGCNLTKDIFENLSEKPLIVSVMLRDNCPGEVSAVGILDENDKLVREESVPDGDQRNLGLTIKPKQRLAFRCRGESKQGRCEYKIISIIR